MKKTVGALSFVLGLSVGCNQNFAHDLTPLTDNFAQTVTYNNKVDIVWIIDTSKSMSQHQNYLSAQVPDLIHQLNSIKMDYRMVVISTDMSASGPGGKFLGEPKVLSASTASLEGALRSRIAYGETASPMERGLESLRETFDPYYLQTEGRGFLRADAMLVVNVLSNEDDDGGYSVDYWANYFDSAKPRWVDGSRSWMFNYIGVTSLSSACSTFGDYSEPGITFMGLADVSGGVKESICTTNLGKAVSNIKKRVFEVMTEFKLSEVPNLETVVVHIDNQLVPQSADNGWTYNSTKNSIVFHGIWVPKADSKISVDFKPASVRSE